MTRYEAMMMKRRMEQRAKLESAASDVRVASREHEIPVKFFGSFAEDCVTQNSDLDILVFSDSIPYQFRSRLDDISKFHDVEFDIVREDTVRHFDMYLVS